MKISDRFKNLVLATAAVAGASVISVPSLMFHGTAFAQDNSAQSVTQDNEVGSVIDESSETEGKDYAENAVNDSDYFQPEESPSEVDSSAEESEMEIKAPLSENQTDENNSDANINDESDNNKNSGVGAVNSIKASEETPNETESPVKEEPVLRNGWALENGAYYYFRNGEKYTGWHLLSSAEGENIPHWSYFGEDGRLRTGWVQLGKGTANPDGDTEKHWSYFGENGWLRTGWVQLGKGTANPDGNTEKHWSYFGSNGWLRTGWAQLGKGTANPDGNTARHWSYFGENGWLRTGWVQLGKGTANPDGNTAKHWSYFGDNGWLRTDWAQLGKGTANPDGNTAKHWSYFGENGWLRTGWQEMGKGTSNPDGNTAKHTSYFGDNGWMRIGEQRINGIYYNFDYKGWLINEDREMLNRAQNYSSSTGYLILVDRTKCKTAIFTGKYGNWKYDKYWSCCVGKPSTPTITGIYKLGAKGLYFNTGDVGRCWYYSQIRGDYLFHSVIYWRDSSPYSIYDGTMGKQVSHGCVRLDVQNAKYIYDRVPTGTTIVIYN